MSFDLERPPACHGRAEELQFVVWVPGYSPAAAPAALVSSQGVLGFVITSL